MRFSILIPVVKTVFFKAAFESATAQTFDDYEIVVLDNKADADISWVAENPRVRYVKNDEQIPPAPNWNKGIELCRGDFIVLLCDDDMLKPETLSSLDEYRSENPDVEVIRFLREEFDGKKILRYSCPGGVVETVDEFVYFQETYLRGNALSDMAFSREAALAIGGFRDIPVGWGCDRLLPLEIGRRKNKIGNLNKVLLTYRRSDVNITADTSTILQKMTGCNLYYLFAKKVLEETPGKFQTKALAINKSRFQGMQDFHFLEAFVHCKPDVLWKLWRLTRNMDTSRWYSVFSLILYITQKCVIAGPLLLARATEGIRKRERGIASSSK